MGGQNGGSEGVFHIQETHSLNELMSVNLVPHCYTWTSPSDRIY